jgi:hypothetical protein
MFQWKATLPRTHLGGAEREPTIEHGKSDLRLAAHLLLEELRDVLHHALQPRGLLEFRPRLVVLVLRIDEFQYHALVLATEGFGVRIHLDDDVIGIAREGRVSGLGIGNVALAIALGGEEGIELVVFDINDEALSFFWPGSNEEAISEGQRYGTKELG